MLFEILNQDKTSLARNGIITTRRGKIETPVFMPVGTTGAIRALTLDRLDEIGASVILGNTYHLFLRPGLEVIKTFGSLHNFMNWHKPILTDSGGFQIFSIKGKNKITEKGVEFLIEKDLYKDVKPIHIDFIETAAGSGFKLTSNMPAGEGCGGGCCC